jgi:hypothetical protein
MTDMHPPMPAEPLAPVQYITSPHIQYRRADDPATRPLSLIVCSPLPDYNDSRKSGWRFFVSNFHDSLVIDFLNLI